MALDPVCCGEVECVSSINCGFVSIKIEIVRSWGILSDGNIADCPRLAVKEIVTNKCATKESTRQKLNTLVEELNGWLRILLSYKLVRVT